MFHSLQFFVTSVKEKIHVERLNIDKEQERGVILVVQENPLCLGWLWLKPDSHFLSPGLLGYEDKIRFQLSLIRTRRSEMLTYSYIANFCDHT